MSRALLIVLDSAGIGGAPDAARYDDEGSNTVGHVALACAAGKGDRPGLRSGRLHLPNMVALGLGEAIRLASGLHAPGLEGEPVLGLHGAGTETSNGKDTPSGHWEIAGFPVDFEWGYFPHTEPCFPPELIAAFLAGTGLPGILGDKHASGTEIIEEFGEEHRASGKPILYTSADSVLQIAAHETTFGLARLYGICAVMRELTRSLAIGRVIARPFVGEKRGAFRRTANRKDWAIEPAEPTILDRLTEAQRKVITIGKIGDIFAHRGTGEEIKAAGNAGLLDAALSAFERLPEGGLVFANLIDFDVEYGHRRDVPGYAAALEAFDRRIPEIMARLGPGDLAIITADHGNDPTWRGTDHTRERVPILAFGLGIGAGSIGVRDSLADIAASLLDHLGLKPGRKGTSFL
ncbi:MAG: phosphopentomutase [Methylobacterium sp.]|nr:phosphopentomutase [Methylobacterium sp.]MCA3603157.1 phosphopentomutase [Methylobacterium sp.]MCA3615597.1 phosphopentomutase [Methylobacterium sp.]MCA4910024.1 phosphopentomutase [Methylobacterium sp.]